MIACIMRRRSAFREMDTAPRDGSLVEVRHGPDQDIVLAYWSEHGQAYIRDDDPRQQPLHLIVGWRPPTGALAVKE